MDSDSMFSIQPMSKSISLEAGQVYEGYITVTNPADATSDFSYYVSVTPYGVSEDGDSANLVDESERTQIAKWIKIGEPTGTLRPNEYRAVHYTITVPETAPAGGQYATITVTSDPAMKADDEMSVQNVFEMASVIYASVAGDIIHDAEILENNVPVFALSTPFTVKSTFNNNGNVHENATIIITVTDFFTGRVILPSDSNNGEFIETVMPGSMRYTERTVENLPPLGAAKISQTIYYNGHASTNEQVVIICPIWFMVAAVVLLAAFITTIVTIIKKRHAKNKFC